MVLGGLTNLMAVPYVPPGAELPPLPAIPLRAKALLSLTLVVEED